MRTHKTRRYHALICHPLHDSLLIEQEEGNFRPQHQTDAENAPTEQIYQILGTRPSLCVSEPPYTIAALESSFKF